MKRLLIANRSEIARRIIRSARRMGIATVAVYAGPDAGALHVREADAAVALGGTASADSYLRIDKLIDAARASGADAVHPGYGFLSENADFAQAVIDAGLTWVGPPPAAIRALGSKSAAKRLAEARGVPCLPGYHGADQSDATLVAEAARIGVPIMVKAAAGGGGRGMRLVTDLAQLPQALQTARGEALAAFGSGELLLERALLSPRHVEVQVFADTHGHCIHLGERDCSVQRRHQKIIEETPSPAVSPALRERMGHCAVELAQAAGYVGAGTVEFLLDGDAFFLMEMNTRLQVEHPVTEFVTGLDLVEWQLRVARGEPLPLAQEAVRFAGHAVEVRLCAEDEHFTPHAGTVKRFVPPQGVRFDHALFEGLAVPPYYDSMLGKLVAHAPTRAEAIAQLALALDRLVLLGLPVNRALLAACLRHPVFAAGQAGIPFLAEHGEAIRAALVEAERAVAVAAGQAVFGGGAPSSAVVGGSASSPGAVHGAASSLHAVDESGVATQAHVRASPLQCPFVRPTRLRHRGELLDGAAAGAAANEAKAALPSGLPVRAGFHAVGLGPRRRHVQWGTVDLVIDDASFDPPAGAGGAGAGDELRAPFNGKVVAVPVAPGATVTRGDVLAVVESMKLEHSLSAVRAGVVAGVAVAVGQQVAPGQLLVALEPAR
jgi:3-methylcrotonyl-CoA carboxylase alpha subunit/geranyl-CoA carboxylase alpha subunit